MCLFRIPKKRIWKMKKGNIQEFSITNKDINSQTQKVLGIPNNITKKKHTPRHNIETTVELQFNKDKDFKKSERKDIFLSEGTTKQLNSQKQKQKPEASQKSIFKEENIDASQNFMSTHSYYLGMKVRYRHVQQTTTK